MSEFQIAATAADEISFAIIDEDATANAKTAQAPPVYGTTKPPMAIPLGEGVFTWDSHQRRSDRYGAVYLIADGQNSFSDGAPTNMLHENACRILVGMKGKLIAVVTQTRASTHVGDIFKKIYPRTPSVGHVIPLGDGEVFVEDEPCGSGVMVGLRPLDGRHTCWLDPRALYDAHEQTVDLMFVPAE